MSDTSGNTRAVAEHALAGRLPVLGAGRIYTGFASYLLTSTAIAAGSYSYLVGTALISVGSTRLGLAGYLIGLVLGMSFVSLAGGALSYRYGVDTVDAGKATLGIRGSFALLIGSPRTWERSSHRSTSPAFRCSRSGCSLDCHGRLWWRWCSYLASL